MELDSNNISSDGSNNNSSSDSSNCSSDSSSDSTLHIVCHSLTIYHHDLMIQTCYSFLILLIVSTN